MPKAYPSTALSSPRCSPDAKGFEIVASARRFRAAQLAGLTELKAIVRELSDAKAF